MKGSVNGKNLFITLEDMPTIRMPFSANAMRCGAAIHVDKQLAGAGQVQAFMWDESTAANGVPRPVSSPAS